MRYNYEDHIRIVEDFPQEGIRFYDIAPLLGNGAVLKTLIEDMADSVDLSVTKVAAFDARGFLLGSALACQLGLGMVMLRKPGKLPGEILQTSYDLEYGSAQLELQAGVLTEADVVMLVDDVIATGGTALAGIDLVRRSGAKIAGFYGCIDLLALGGSQKIAGAGVEVQSVISIEGQ